MSANEMIVALKAEGQSLTVWQGSPAVENAPIDLLRFTVVLSEEWDEYENPVLLVRHDKDVFECDVSEGAATCDISGLLCSDRLEAAIMAQSGTRRMTTERAVISRSVKEVRALYG